jgi:tRNA U34 5-methylaminomethyl-2-thiouridine-forming methyltransferase MnmC
MNTDVKTTLDGSSTLYVPGLNEHYHSINGAVQESMHVYIRSGLNEAKQDNLKLLEIGFGTGLNALLTLLENAGKKTIQYDAIELFPLDWSTIEQLQYPEYLGISNESGSLFRSMHISSWEKDFWIDPAFCLRKIGSSLLDVEFTTTYNLVYFDAFAPKVQPELWTEEIFRKICNAMENNGQLVTYCAKGEVRRCMQRAGFNVERLPGPPGKREMLRARKPDH